MQTVNYNFNTTASISPVARITLPDRCYQQSYLLRSPCGCGHHRAVLTADTNPNTNHTAKVKCEKCDRFLGWLGDPRKSKLLDFNDTAPLTASQFVLFRGAV